MPWLKVYIYIYVSPHPTKYENATATYIHRVKILSHAYSKHKVLSGIRVRKHNDIIHSNKLVHAHGYHWMWSDITGILHHQEVQKYNYRKIYKYEQYKKCSQDTTRNLKSRAGGAERQGYGKSTAKPRSRALWLAARSSPRSKLWNLDMQVQSLLEK